MPFWLVPACRECNTNLGTLPVLLIGARKSYLAKRYRNRYRRILNTPAWTQEEMDDLSPNLRAGIESAERIRESVVARLEVLTQECIEPTLEDYRARLDDDLT